MTEISLKPFYIEPFTVRLTNQDRNFVSDNSEELFDGDEVIRPRQAFMMLCEKALLKVKANNKSNPEDEMRIAQLTDSLANHQSLVNEQNEKIEQLTSEKAELQNRLDQALQQIQTLQQNLEIKIQEVLKEKEVDMSTQRLLNLKPFEAFILAQIETVHKCDAKSILIDRFFMVYQKRGNGDYDIKRISPSKMAEIEAAFKAQSQTQQ